MWFLASEVVPVSRPQHSDLQGEDNRGNSSDEIKTTSMNRRYMMRTCT